MTEHPLFVALHLAICTVIFFAAISWQFPDPNKVQAQQQRDAAASAADKLLKGPSKQSVAQTMSGMPPPAANLAPPKDDPISVDELKKCDGSDPDGKIYVAIKVSISTCAQQVEESHG